MATRTLNVLLTGDATSMQKSFASATSAAGKAKIGIAAAAVGAGLALKELYDVGAEFDEAFDTIRVGTGKTGKQLDRLKGDFKNVVSSVPTDFEPAAEAVSELTKRLGLTGKALRRESKQFLELSRITDTDVGENIKTVTRAFGDWEIKTKDQGKQLDSFFRASQLSGASVSELADIVVKFGSPLRQFGFGLDEATAMFASFEKAGVNIQTMVPGLKVALKTFLEEGKEPGKALKQTFKGIEDGSIKSAAALKIFGGRAGADMIEAVEQGRFHLAKFTQQIAGGNDTIRKAGKETMDASEKFHLLGNKLKVLVEPAATAVFDSVGKLADVIGQFVTGVQRGTGAGGQFRSIVEGIGGAVLPVVTSLADVTLGFAAFSLEVASSKAGIVVLSGVVGALIGRMAVLGAIWAVGKIVAFVSAISNAVIMVRTAIEVTTSLRAAMGLLTASTFALRAAFVTTGIGAVVVGVGLAIAAFTSLNKTNEKTVSVFKRSKQAFDGLRAASHNLNQARDAERSAAGKVKEAEQRLNRARREHGPASKPAIRAELAYKQALNESNAATKRAKNLERLHGAERRAVAQIIMADARKLAVQSERANELRRAEAEGLKGLFRMYKNGEATLGQVRARYKSLNEATADADKKSKRLKETVARAGQEIGPKYAGQLDKAIGKAKKMERNTSALGRALQGLPRKKTTDVDVRIHIGGISTGGGGSGGKTGDGPGVSPEQINSSIDKSITEKVQKAANANPMDFLMAGIGGVGTSGVAFTHAPGAVDVFNPFASRFGLGVTSGYRPGSITSSGNVSYHSLNRARDYADGAPAMLAFAKFMAAVFGSQLTELIHTPLGFSIKDGQRTAPYATADHYDHVHVALQSGGVAEGIVPGRGSGDKVPLSILAEPGEKVFVLNRNATAALHTLGGLNAAIPRFQTGGGFTGSGFTVKGVEATVQQRHTAMEIMKAADATGAGHLARVAALMAATQESGMGATGNTFQLTQTFEGVSPSDSAYKQAVQWFTKGYYHGGGIGLSKKFSDPGDIAQEVEGSAYPDAYDPWKRESQHWVDSWGGSGGGSAEAAAKSGPASTKQKHRLNVIQQKAEAVLEEAQKLKHQYGKTGGTAAGKKALDRSLKLAKEAAEQRKAGNSAHAKKLIEESKDELEKSRKALKAARAGAFEAGLKPTPLLPSAKALGADVQARLKARGLTYAGKTAIGEQALEAAEGTETHADDEAVLAFQKELLQRRKKGLQGKLKQVNKELGGKQTKAQRKKSLARRAHIEEELAGVEGGLAGVRSSGAALGEGEGGEGEETDAQRAAREATEAQTKAAEDLAQAIESQKAEQEALRKEMELTRHITESELATSAAVAAKAISDIVAGQLGPRAFYRAQTAGAGSVGTF
jgi:Phage-related minor tail protein